MTTQSYPLPAVPMKPRQKGIDASYAGGDGRTTRRQTVGMFYLLLHKTWGHQWVSLGISHIFW